MGYQREENPANMGSMGPWGKTKGSGTIYLIMWVCLKMGCPPPNGYLNAANDDETYLLEGIPYPIGIYIYINTGWWFGTWLLFSPIVGKNHPN